MIHNIFFYFRLKYHGGIYTDDQNTDRALKRLVVHKENQIHRQKPEKKR